MSSSEEVGYGPPGECVSMGKMATYHLQKLYTRVVDENDLIRAVLRRMPCEGCDMHIGTPYNMHTFCGNCAKKIVADEQTT